MTTVRCGVCLRREAWGADGAVQVLQEGGGRLPAEAPVIARWRTIRAARAGGDRVVGECPCGQLLTGDAAALPEVVLTTPGGELRVGEVVRGPDGPVADDDVEAWLRARVPVDRSGRVGRAIFVSFGLVIVGAMVLAWVWAAHFVVFFIWYGVPNGALELR